MVDTLSKKSSSKGKCRGCGKSLELEFSTRYCGDCNEQIEYMPTPAEIAAERLLIQATWTPIQELARRVGPENMQIPFEIQPTKIVNSDGRPIQ